MSTLVNGSSNNNVVKTSEQLRAERKENIRRCNNFWIRVSALVSIIFIIGALVGMGYVMDLARIHVMNDSSFVPMFMLLIFGSGALTMASLIFLIPRQIGTLTAADPVAYIKHRNNRRDSYYD